MMNCESIKLTHESLLRGKVSFKNLSQFSSLKPKPKEEHIKEFQFDFVRQTGIKDKINLEGKPNLMAIPLFFLPNLTFRV